MGLNGLSGSDNLTGDGQDVTLPLDLHGDPDRGNGPDGMKRTE